jgi:fructokinase
MALWGIDLGGTKVEVVILDGPTPESQLLRMRMPTESHRGYEFIVQRVAELVKRASSESGIPYPSRIGIGTPGSMDPTSGLMRNCNTTCLNDRPLPADLASALGCEVITANDANCFALAEAKFGAGRGRNVVFGIIMGTGVGGGVVTHGHVLNGRHGIAGEWGHTSMVPDGPECYCGKRGCLERMCSGPHLEQFYESLTGTRLSLPEILAKGDSASRAVEDRLVEVTAEALGAVINLIDPDAVVFGGGVAQADCLHQRLPEELRKWVFHPEPTTPLLRPELGDSAGVFGAALLVA